MTDGETLSQFDEARSDRVAGALLTLSAALSVVVMANHPSGAHAGAIGAFVHGAMIVLLSIASYGFLRFAIRFRLRPPMVAGVIAYAISLFGHIAAATVNGFVVPALAQQAGVAHDVFLFAWELNQACARLGVCAAGVAFVLWSIPLLNGRTTGLRVLGALGLLIGLAQLTAILTGSVRPDVHGALLLYGLHAVWAAPVGVFLYRGKVAG